MNCKGLRSVGWKQPHIVMTEVPFRTEASPRAAGKGKEDMDRCAIRLETKID